MIDYYKLTQKSLEIAVKLKYLTDFSPELSDNIKVQNLVELAQKWSLEFDREIANAKQSQ